MMRSSPIAPIPPASSSYQALVDAGYRNVRRHAGGLSDWTNAGYQLEGTSVAE